MYRSTGLCLIGYSFVGSIQMCVCLVQGLTYGPPAVPTEGNFDELFRDLEGLAGSRPPNPPPVSGVS